MESAASAFNAQTTTAYSGVSAAAYSNYELNWATYLVDQSSSTAFSAYNASTGYYTVGVYTNATVQARYEDSSGNALTVMGTSSPFTRSAAQYALLTASGKVRVANSTSGRNVARDYAGSNRVNGTVMTGVSITSGTVYTTSITSPVLSWVPYSGILSGSTFSITFSSTTLSGTGTIVDGARQVTVTVSPTGTYSYSFLMTNLQAPSVPGGLDPMNRLGYGNE